MKRISEVTEPHLPPLTDYVRLLEGIWERRRLTNGGPLVQEFEHQLRSYLESTSSLHCVANGGLALQLLMKAMKVSGEIITTPYSYVATTSCPLWEGCHPVFADIDDRSLNLDPAAVAAAITPRTEAVLATHVFGNPCDIEALQSLCDQHGIALLFDAAHAFGVKHQGRSILEFGDAAMVSLHATKLIHSVEGGIISTRNPEVSRKLEWMRRFGHDGTENYHGVGINAKMSELHAAMGLCVLQEADSILQLRRQRVTQYLEGLETMDGLRFAFDLQPGTEWNFCYLPVRFDHVEDLTRCKDSLA
ncbi:MAG: DegT/DnrJ/EryC1/StrS family aminotransferase, partial [Verrucomicrobiales bacterium]